MASFLTPRNVCYQQNQIKYIDYFGKGLVVFDRNKAECLVYGTDQDLVHEIVYLFLWVMYFHRTCFFVVYYDIRRLYADCFSKAIRFTLVVWTCRKFSPIVSDSDAASVGIHAGVMD